MRFNLLFISLFFFACGSVDAVDMDSGTGADSASVDSSSSSDEGGSVDVTEEDAGSDDVVAPEDAGAATDAATTDEGEQTEDAGSSTTCVTGEEQTCVSVCNTVGSQTCDEDGEWGTCWPPEETCNGVDDDCNNTVDDTPEGCDCVDNSTQSCGSDEGECVAGSQTCVDGQWGECGGDDMVLPAAEICDGLDNDCNGVPDDPTDAGCECEAGETQACGTNVGECTTGTAACDNGFWGVCDGVGPVAEVCNNLDDDCNGALDDLASSCFDAAGTFQLLGVTAANLNIELSTEEVDCQGLSIQGCIIPVQPNDTFLTKCTVPATRDIIGFEDTVLMQSVSCPGPGCMCESTVTPVGGTRCTYSRVMPASSITVKCIIGAASNEPKD